MAKLQKKNIKDPDKTVTFPNGNVDFVVFEDMKFGLTTFEPGWKWSEHVKPIAKTNSCQALHTNYHLSGKLHVKMDDGTEEEFGPGDIGVIPPGHDAWTVGNEPAVFVDVSITTPQK
jgi:quercetin dioxygenase-like cupin family protein